MARTEHFIGLEWLRFLLAIYVVLFHTVHAYVEDEPTWLSELAGVGFFATSSFFVLSGFLLAHVYCRQGELREPARQFHVHLLEARPAAVQHRDQVDHGVVARQQPRQRGRIVHIGL